MSFTANGVGGEYNHELLNSEIPNHAHAVGIWESSGDLDTTPYEFIAIKGSYYADGQSHSLNSIHTSYSGKNFKHNNIQPYYVVNYWKRIN